MGLFIQNSDCATPEEIKLLCTVFPGAPQCPRPIPVPTIAPPPKTRSYSRVDHRMAMTPEDPISRNIVGLELELKRMDTYLDMAYAARNRLHRELRKSANSNYMAKFTNESQNQCLSFRH
ncbi:unnamed protein product [Caenorhabditis bovis]|uniref:Uncharacterized protein n=1 Tax=Caenorhabditis bovis TaxID=2654633 RepID=A0A8S1FC39_9PELO|nr:unnamed protein product [Caenorhabditis bovis]